MTNKGVELSKIVRLLNIYCSPHLAEKWDNVGLLIEPSSPHFVKNMFITNDLTESVLNEAITKNANLILSYHPPIFKAVRRITQNHWKDRILVRAIENRIAIYSPHTGLDAKFGGINDWLLKPFDIVNKTCLNQSPAQNSIVLFKITLNENFCSFLMNNALKLSVANIDRNEAELSCPSENFDSVLHFAKDLNLLISSSTTISKTRNEGCGRLAQLKVPVPLNEILNRYKRHFQTNNLVFALGKNRKLDDPVNSVAVCAGSGSSICQTSQAFAADLFVTGELSHHDRLEAVERGISVILAGHSVTERGFFRDQFVPEFLNIINSDNTIQKGQLSIHLSELDVEPGCIV